LFFCRYGNTHSETSLCAQQSTIFREEARSIIKKSVNANENDVLLFTGTGSTGAVHTLVDSFGLHNANNRKNVVVIVSVFEHHSNILPWQETGVEVNYKILILFFFNFFEFFFKMVRIPTTQQGILDKGVLKEKLQHYSKLRKRIICSLSAASNITGILTDVDAISTLVHSYSGLVFWDYAAAAPYIKIDMNPSATAYKDGPNTPCKYLRN
jgi:selenocysteine lyase/cysteine desulfurase